MSSSPYQMVPVKIENVNLAMLLSGSTDIQYIRYEGLCQVYLCSVQNRGLFTNIEDIRPVQETLNSTLN